jgi:hypothetical protein
VFSLFASYMNLMKGKGTKKLTQPPKKPSPHLRVAYTRSLASRAQHQWKRDRNGPRGKTLNKRKAQHPSKIHHFSA